ncbi:hypothetical protein CsSME_00001787 [Camellia sinensis var. sinensis]
MQESSTITKNFKESPKICSSFFKNGFVGTEYASSAAGSLLLFFFDAESKDLHQAPIERRKRPGGWKFADDVEQIDDGEFVDEEREAKES